MTFVKISNSIQKKIKQNDIRYTPITLVERHIEHIKDLIEFGDVIYEPFAGKGVYVNHLREKFPNNQIEQTEIETGTNFFLFNESVDIIISNPPYSCMDKVLEHSVKLKPKIISYLIGYLNLTPRRVKFMNDNGFFIERMFVCKIRSWFGISCIITFSNQIDKNIIEVERNEFKYD
jgi:hypothetical protein